jgi:lycopene beta-cyclase
MALQLKRKLGPDKTILILDREAKNVNDRSWAFWAKEKLPLGLDRIVKHRWSALRFVGEGWEKSSPVDPYCYQFIRGLDYYCYMKEQLSAYSNIEWRLADVGLVGEDELGAYACIGDERCYADWIFDSRLNSNRLEPRQPNQYFLWQHFRGWRIRTATAVFSPQQATLMDFSKKTQDTAAFFYVLPFSEHEALVEYTVFSAAILSQQQYDEQLAIYLEQTIPGVGYQVVEKEFGQIPMTNLDLADRSYRRIRSIGSAGNAVKPTTGYAFLRIQLQVEMMAEQLSQTGDISNEKTANNRLDWYDNLLLYILQHHPQRSKRIFSALFSSQPFARIMKFLDQDTHLGEEALIFKDLPISYFLEAAFHHFWDSKGRSTPRPVVGIPTNRL